MFWWEDLGPGIHLDAALPHTCHLNIVAHQVHSPWQQQSVAAAASPTSPTSPETSQKLLRGSSRNMINIPRSPNCKLPWDVTQQGWFIVAKQPKDLLLETREHPWSPAFMSWWVRHGSTKKSNTTQTNQWKCLIWTWNWKFVFTKLFVLSWYSVVVCKLWEMSPSKSW